MNLEANNIVERLQRWFSLALGCALFTSGTNWASAQSFQWLGHLRGAEPEGRDSFARGVSGDGTVVGDYVTPPISAGPPVVLHNSVAFSWKAGVYTELPLTRANYISPNSREIFGELDVWDEIGNFRISTSSLRWALNDEDEVEVTAAIDGAIVSLDDGIPMPILNKTAYQQANGKWKEATHFTNFRIRGVSDDGRTFVGAKYPGLPADPTSRAAVWTEETETILPLIAGHEGFYSVHMEALAVSGNGSVVVGYADVRFVEGSSVNQLFAFIWTREGGIRTIADEAKALGVEWQDGIWEPYQATAISSDGRFVAGWGDLDGEHYEPWLLELVPAIEIVVNSTTDRPRAANATGCETGEYIANGERECTLRSAIQAVNAGVGATIEFDIPGDDIPVIILTSALPALSKAVKIDGTTQKAGRVEIRGGGLDMAGLDLTAGESEIRGLVMNGFVGNNSVCIRLQSGGENTVAGNFLGTDASGSTSVATSYGLSINDSADNQIGGAEVGSQNVFGSERAIGIRGDRNKITGNRIGVGLDGSLLSAVTHGVAFLSGNENEIGGEGSLRNLVAAEEWDILISPEVPINGLSIRGNLIGLDGTGKLAHGGRGVSIGVVASLALSLSNLRIENNQIAGGSPEIWLAGGGVSGATISDNAVGLAFDGSGNLPTFVSEENRDWGVRLDNSSDSTIFGNSVVGHRYNIMISGENQYVEVGDEIVLKVPGNELDPPPAGAPSINTLIEDNSIGLFANTKTAGSDVLQEIGIAVFGHAKNVTIRNNTVAGHNDDEMWLVNGEGHAVLGNRIGTVDGTDFGSRDGVVVADAKNVRIGSNNPGDGNVISRNSGVAIKVRDGADGVQISGNLIGVNADASAVWPNGTGIAVTNSGGEGSPASTVIRNNMIGGNLAEGIYLSTPNNTLLEGNFIGRSAAGLELPNRTGIKIEDAEARLERNTIAHNTEDGVVIEGEAEVFISRGAIYDNGDGSREHGIRYDVEPFDPGHIVGVIRAPSSVPGKFVVFLGARVAGDLEQTIEIFANDRPEDPQGQVFLLRMTLQPGETLTQRLEVDANHPLVTGKSFSATITRGKSTSEFSKRQVAVGIPRVPVLEFLPSDPGMLSFLWAPAGYFKLEEAPSVTGPWRDSLATPVTREVDGVTVETATLPLSPQPQRFYRVNISLK